MRVYFLRHGDADWPDWEGSDDERPLNKRGKKEMRRVAKFLSVLDLKPDEILTSPLPRARETADIAAERFKLHVREEDTLAGGFNADALKDLVRKYHVDNLMVVGHEPNFSEVIADLTGADCKLSKGGFALVELDDEKMEGRLLWLFPPKIAKAL
jgi:phosphohistidine phosphatase